VHSHTFFKNSLQTWQLLSFLEGNYLTKLGTTHCFGDLFPKLAEDIWMVGQKLDHTGQTNCSRVRARSNIGEAGHPYVVSSEIAWYLFGDTLKLRDEILGLVVTLWQQTLFGSFQMSLHRLFDEIDRVYQPLLIWGKH
jgi:hypothetical protein